MAGEIASVYVQMGYRDGGFQQGMSRARAEISGVSTAAGRVIPQLGMLQSALGVGVAGGALLMATNLAKATVELGAFGAQAERMGTAFAQAWGGGETALERLRDASRDTVSDLDLMAAANRSAMLGVTSNVSELAGLLEIAADRGRYFGLTTTQAFDSMVTGIGRLSPLILDNIGLTVDAEATYKAYADQIGVAADKLTDAEKKAALVNRVLREGREQLAGASVAGRDAAGNYEYFAAQVENLKQQWSLLIADALSPYIGLLGDALKLTRQLFADPVSNLARSVVEAGGSFADFNKEYAKFVELQRQSAMPSDPIGRLAQSIIDQVIPQQVLSLEELQAVYGRVQAEAAATNREVASMDPTAVDQTRFAVQDLEDAYRNLAAVARVSFSEVESMFESNISRVIEDYGEMVARGEIERAVAEAHIAALRGVGQSIIATMGDKELLDVDRLWLSEVMTTALGEAEGPIAEAEQRIRERSQRVFRGGLSDAQRAADQWATELRGIVEGALRPTFAGDPTGMLDSLGLHIHTADEGARRLASVMAEGLSSEWTSHFAATGLLTADDLLSDETVRAAAARLLRLQQFGPLPGLTDKEAAVEQVRAVVEGKARMQALVNEILADPRVGGLGISRADVSAALGDPAAQAAVVAADVSRQVAALPPASVRVSLDVAEFVTPTLTPLSVPVALDGLDAAYILTWAGEQEPLLKALTFQVPVALALQPLEPDAGQSWRAEVEGLQFDAAPVLGPPSAPQIAYWHEATKEAAIEFAARADMIAPNDTVKLGWRIRTGLVDFAARPDLQQPTAEELGTWRSAFVAGLAGGEAGLGVAAALALAIETDLAATGDATLGADAKNYGGIWSAYFLDGIPAEGYVSALSTKMAQDFGAHASELEPVARAVGQYVGVIITDELKKNVNIVQGVVDAAVLQMAQGLIDAAQDGQTGQ